MVGVLCRSWTVTIVDLAWGRDDRLWPVLDRFARRDPTVLAHALARDDHLHDAGMHPDERVTRRLCRSWADQTHGPGTGARVGPGRHARPWPL